MAKASFTLVDREPEVFDCGNCIGILNSCLKALHSNILQRRVLIDLFITNNNKQMNPNMLWIRIYISRVEKTRADLHALYIAMHAVP